MAVPAKEVELLVGGADVFEYESGAFVQNMQFRRNSWIVRPGFGQRAQYDSSFFTRFEDNAAGASGTEQGLLKHLGSTLFEHGSTRQIVSVFACRVIAQDNATSSQAVKLFTVQIYDLNTQERWEEAAYTDTSDGEVTLSQLAFRHGVYETNYDHDRTAWGFATELSVFFTQFEGRLFFGNSEVGLYVYSPSTFRKNRPKAVNKTFDSAHTQEAYSESSVVRRFYLTTGLHRNAQIYSYLESHEVGGPVGVAGLFRRLVFADKDNVYISDIDVASAFNGINTVPIPGGSQITAIASHLGSILIWTQDEMWRFTPSDTQIASNGSLVKVSESVGCVGQPAVTTVGDMVVWVDRSGVYTTQNGLAIKEISGPIRPFFESFITNPYTSYFTKDGTANLTNSQPQTVLRFKEDFIHLAYSEQQHAFYVGFPHQRMGFLYSNGQWSFWSFESVVKMDSAATPVSEVGTTKNISEPWVVADEDTFYCVGSIDSQLLSDVGEYWNASGPAWVDRNYDVLDRSYYLLEQGRGGAIDRNVADEDYRKVRGEWRQELNAAGSATTRGFVFEKWERIPANTTMPSGGVIGATEEAYWIPISLYGDSSSSFAALVTSFYFDANNWEPLFTTGVSTVLDFIVPNERIATVSGYRKAAPAPGLEEVQCYVAGGAASRTGQEIKIYWTQLAGLPAIVTNGWARTPLILLPFRRKSTTQADSVSGLQIQKGSVFPAADSLFAWEQWSMGTGDKRAEDNVAQPVDWSYKSPQVGLDDDLRYKARGLYIRMTSRGNGTNVNFLSPNWLFGPLNTVLSSDQKGWSSQIIDYTGDTSVSQDEAITLIQDKTTIRTRVLSGGALWDKVFDTAAVTYADPAVAATGTILADDTEMNTMATSDNVRGQTFSYMMFGHMQERAQGILLDSVKAAFRLLGSRHRWGR